MTDLLQKGLGKVDTTENTQTETDNGVQDLRIIKNQLHGEIIDYQKEGEESQYCAAIGNSINATYQHHLSCHVNSCLPCRKKKKEDMYMDRIVNVGIGYRIGNEPRQKLMLYLREVHGCFGQGTKLYNHLYKYYQKEGPMIFFQNVSCPAISESKLSCNINVALVFDGPIAQYQIKSMLKGTQEDDTTEYAEVEKSIKKLNGVRAHENDKSEAMRLVARAMFAHNSNSIISALMANFLTRNSKRFYFSHKFAYYPVKDMV